MAHGGASARSLICLLADVCHDMLAAMENFDMLAGGEETPLIYALAGSRDT